MTDDICGAECADGSPCEHPAGSCPVPSHDDPAAENPQGRPHLLTDERHNIVVETIRNIEPLTSAAERAGVDPDTIRNWYDEGEQQATRPPEERDARYDFFEDCASARADAKAELLERMDDGDVDWRMIAWKLEHLYESDFYLPVKQEIEHDGAVDTGEADVVVNFGGDE